MSDLWKRGCGPPLYGKRSLLAPEPLGFPGSGGPLGQNTDPSPVPENPDWAGDTVPPTGEPQGRLGHRDNGDPHEAALLACGSRHPRAAAPGTGPETPWAALRGPRTGPAWLGSHQSLPLRRPPREATPRWVQRQAVLRRTRVATSLLGLAVTGRAPRSARARPRRGGRGLAGGSSWRPAGRRAPKSFGAGPPASP